MQKEQKRNLCPVPAPVRFRRLTVACFRQVELVELYNEAYKADKRRRQDEALRAFLFDDDGSDE